MKDFVINTDILVPDVKVSTYPQGPRGVGIKSITQQDNYIYITFDDGNGSIINFPDWWFGTKEMYYALSPEERNRFSIHFIREDDAE